MKKIKNLRMEIQYELLVLPALILYAVFCLYPFLFTFYYSITNYSDFNINDFKIIGFSNYLEVFKIDMLMSALKNSIIYSMLMTVFQSLLAIPLAVLLNKKLKTTNILRAAFFLPAMFSPLVVGFLWNFMMSPTEFGLINKLVTALGYNKINFLGNPDIALYSIIATQIWQWVGWAAVIYLANLQTISKEYYEAAKIDGAGDVQCFWKITVPLLNPAVTVVVINSMVGGLKIFDIVYAMTQGGPGYATETIMTAMIKKGFNEGYYSVAAAFGVIFFVIVMIISSAVLKILRKWEEKII